MFSPQNNSLEIILTLRVFCNRLTGLLVTQPSCGLFLRYITSGHGPQLQNQILTMYITTLHKTVIWVKPGHTGWRKCPLVFPLMSYDCSLNWSQLGDSLHTAAAVAAWGVLEGLPHYLRWFGSPADGSPAPERTPQPEPSEWQCNSLCLY